MEILDTIKSNDGATKRVVRYEDGLIGEVTYVDYPNKDIVCVPTQVACKMGCAFCHLSNVDLESRNLRAYEMEQLIDVAVHDVAFRRPLVVSFMGSGEPLLNYREMVWAMYTEHTCREPGEVRFAFATMIPRGAGRNLLLLADAIKEFDLPVKCHLSLHFTDDVTRRQYMPQASDIKTSLGLLESYVDITGNAAEIHYTLMDGINDGDKDLAGLAREVRPDIGIKILHYSQNPKLDTDVSPRVDTFVEELKKMGYKAEYYKPNGLDIGSSCGQFDLSRYKRKA
jgi:23S rRNA (adenine2503-C2)-methyltransferase